MCFAVQNTNGHYNSASTDCAAGNVVVGGTDGCPVQQVACTGKLPMISAGSGDYVQQAQQCGELTMPKGCGGAKVTCGPKSVTYVPPTE